MKTVSIIGSFRKEKHYNKILEVIDKLKSNDVTVVSPAGTEVVYSIDDFVIFSSDDKQLTPTEIEAATLEKILASDIVYVCNVDGYIGRTTAYEIGRCEGADKEMYFLEYPVDLPVCLPANLMSPDDLVEYALGNIKTRHR